MQITNISKRYFIKAEKKIGLYFLFYQNIFVNLGNSFLITNSNMKCGTVSIVAIWNANTSNHTKREKQIANFTEVG